MRASFSTLPLECSRGKFSTTIYSILPQDKSRNWYELPYKRWCWSKKSNSCYWNILCSNMWVTWRAIYRSIVVFTTHLEESSIVKWKTQKYNAINIESTTDIKTVIILCSILYFRVTQPHYTRILSTVLFTSKSVHALSNNIPLPYIWTMPQVSYDVMNH